jgi:hypothetical protein
MEARWSADMWRTPVGSGIFTFLIASGMGVSFRGVIKLPRKKE